MYEVTLVLPEDTEELENKFAEVIADIVAKKLSHKELGVFIDKLEGLDKAQL